MTDNNKNPQVAHKRESNNHVLGNGESANALAAAYLYFAALLLGAVNVPLSSLSGITDFGIRSRCKYLLTSFKITIKVKPMTQRRHRE
jgi:transcription initiation factor TFIIB